MDPGERRAEPGEPFREIRETRLPGLGIRYEFVTARGSLLGVVHHRTGRRELLVYDPDDPDTCKEVIALDEADSRTLAELLGGSRVAEQLEEMHRAVEGLSVDRLPVPEDTPFVGRTIGDMQVRTRTGVSIVAVLRGGRAFPAPGPDFRFQAGDVLLVVGTARGIEALAVILRSG
jgi:TrkA domain protein